MRKRREYVKIGSSKTDLASAHTSVAMDERHEDLGMWVSGRTLSSSGSTIVRRSLTMHRVTILSAASPLPPPALPSLFESDNKTED
jgi:hypothetical protein